MQNSEILYEAERRTFVAHAREFVGMDLGTDVGRPVQELLFTTFKDALEYIAVNRGVERWPKRRQDERYDLPAGIRRRFSGPKECSTSTRVDRHMPGV